MSNTKPRRQRRGLLLYNRNREIPNLRRNIHREFLPRSPHRAGHDCPARLDAKVLGYRKRRLHSFFQVPPLIEELEQGDFPNKQAVLGSQLTR